MLRAQLCLALSQIPMRLSTQSSNSQLSFQQKRSPATLYTKATLSEKQKQAISAAFQSTLLSSPHITLDLVLQAAEK